MMALYNLSISQPGLIELLKNSKLITQVSKSIQSERNTELSLLSLRLLQAIAMQIPSARTYQEIVEVVSAMVIHYFQSEKTKSQKGASP